MPPTFDVQVKHQPLDESATIVWSHIERKASLDLLSLTIENLERRFLHESEAFEDLVRKTAYSLENKIVQEDFLKRLSQNRERTHKVFMEELTVQLCEDSQWCSYSGSSSAFSQKQF